MALTLKEINWIIQGIIRPEETTLTELIATQARKHALFHRDKLKDIEDNELAQSYKTKFQNSINNIVVQNNNDIAKRILPNFVDAISKTRDIADIRVLDTAGWETLVEDEMGELFETASGIVPEEKQAYDSYNVGSKGKESILGVVVE